MSDDATPTPLSAGNASQADHHLLHEQEDGSTKSLLMHAHNASGHAGSMSYSPTYALSAANSETEETQNDEPRNASDLSLTYFSSHALPAENGDHDSPPHANETDRHKPHHAGLEMDIPNTANQPLHDENHGTERASELAPASNGRFSESPNPSGTGSAKEHNRSKRRTLIPIEESAFVPPKAKAQDSDVGTLRDLAKMQPEKPASFVDLQAITALLRDTIYATEFAYAEIWIRKVKHVPKAETKAEDLTNLPRSGSGADGAETYHKFGLPGLGSPRKTSPRKAGRYGGRNSPPGRKVKLESATDSETTAQAEDQVGLVQTFSAGSGEEAAITVTSSTPVEDRVKTNQETSQKRESESISVNDSQSPKAHGNHSPGSELRARSQENGSPGPKMLTLKGGNSTKGLGGRGSPTGGRGSPTGGRGSPTRGAGEHRPRPMMGALGRQATHMFASGMKMSMAIRHKKPDGVHGDGDPELDHIEYHSSLKYSRHCYFLPDRFPMHQDKERLKKLLQQFESQTKKVKYTKGESLPGLSWARGSMDWHDLYSLPHDDDLAADPRVVTAKKLFDISLGIPLLDKYGTVFAILMLYRSGNSKGLRPNENVKRIDTPPFQDLVNRAGQFLGSMLHMEELRSQWKLKLRGVVDEKEDEDEDEDAAVTTSSQRWARFYKYLEKYKGEQTEAPPGHGLRYTAWSFIGTFLSVILVAGIDNYFQQSTYKKNTMFSLIASFGAVGVMCFAAPTSPLVQPRNLIGGHIISVVVAILLDYLIDDAYFPIIPQWAGNAIGPAIATFLMCLTGLVHPPASACVIIYISGDEQVKNAHWLFLVVPVLLDCFIMLVLGVIINNMSRTRHFPLYW